MNNVLNEGKEDFSKPILWIVIPCYNEEDVLPITAPMFLEQIQTMISKKKISAKSRILFVNDGSKDSTWDIICKLAQEDEHYIGISQSRNRGHQNAVLAGLMEARDVCDITISIDCDGQDDITAMERMADEYLAGAEVVYGVRSKRDTDTFFKRFTAESFYKLLDKMGVETVYNHADYRLISARVLQEFAGESHYPLSKMIAIAVDGITSLSVRPISIITGTGCVVSLIGFVGIIWAIITAILGNAVAGWTSIVCIVCFLGGIQLLSLGVIGEYIVKIYLESKHRPRYIISEKTWEPYERHYKG